MMIAIRRAAALVAVLTLLVGNIAVCAGWQAVPEARKACCLNSPVCPMHKSDGHEHSATRVISQAQADSCCAASAQQRESAAAGSIFAASGVIAFVPVAVFTDSTSTLVSPEWRAAVPRQASSVPKHLLLSVLLV